MGGDTADLERYRGRLFGIAYRMLGSRTDAEDIVQEAYLRWHRLDTPEEVRSAEAWLVTVVTRLSIDHHRAAATRREQYVGPWLPEPIVTSHDPSPEATLELASNLSIAFLVLVERLAPEERAAFLLHDVFDCGYPEIARILGKREPACRQMVHRARQRVRSGQSRFTVDPDEQRRLLDQFEAAMQTADEAALRALFAADVTLTSDGGGKAPAATNVLTGSDRVVRLFAGVARKVRGRLTFTPIAVNGEPGFLMCLDGRPLSVGVVDVVDGRIAALYQQMNPDKLNDLSTRLHHGGSHGTTPQLS